MKKILAPIFLLLLAALLLGACTPLQAAPPGEGAAITVTDALGREVTFQSAPRRIVITGKALFMVADAAYLFPEASRRIVGLGNAGQGSNNFIALIDPDYESKSVLERDASAEQIAALQPDLVILKSFLAEKVGAPIEALGIPVIYVDFETPEEYARDLDILGQVFGDPQRAKDVAAYYQETMDQVQTALEGVTTHPRVLLLYHNAKDGQVAFNVPPETWMQTRLVQMAGGEPVWTQANLGKSWTQVSLEQIAAWDADQIFIIDYFGNPDEVVSQLQDDPAWGDLRAVQDGHLHAFPGDLYSWDQPDPRWALGLTWLAATLHPEAFPDFDVVQQAQTFYQTLYGLDAEAFNAQILPVLRAEQP